MFLALVLILFHAVLIASGVGVPPPAKCAFLNVVDFDKASNAPALLSMKDVKLVNDPPLILEAIDLPALIPATAVVMLFANPLALMLLGNAVLATPLMSPPATLPSGSFKIPKPSCLSHSLVKFFMLPIRLPAFNTVPKNAVGELNACPLVMSPNTSLAPAATPP